jgi:hypothetical protein
MRADIYGLVFRKHKGYFLCRDWAYQLWTQGS